MIQQDIRQSLLNDPAIHAIVSDRIFLNNPIQQSGNNPYIVFSRQNKTRDMVSEQNTFQFSVFSQDLVVLQNLCDDIISFFENRKNLNGNEYFSLSLLNQTDGRSRLDNGFYWSTLTFEFKNVT